MRDVLNIHISSWTANNFMNYIEHSLAGIVVDWYDNLKENDKIVLETSNIPKQVLNKFVKYVEEEYLGQELYEDRQHRI